MANSLDLLQKFSRCYDFCFFIFLQWQYVALIPRYYKVGSCLCSCLKDSVIRVVANYRVYLVHHLYYVRSLTKCFN